MINNLLRLNRIIKATVDCGVRSGGGGCVVVQADIKKRKEKERDKNVN